MTRLQVFATKFIYILFVMWLGILAPLIYFDQFATSHRVQPYRFALFEGGSRAHSLPPAAIEARLRQQFQQQLTRQQDTISVASPFAGLAHAWQWSLGQLYIVAALTAWLLLLFSQLQRTGCLFPVSTNLPPPKKPPRLV